MQPKRVIGRIWGIVSPIIIYTGISMVVQIVAIFMSVSLYEYAIEVTTAGALISLPILAYMMYKDQKHRNVEPDNWFKYRWRGYGLWLLLVVIYVLGMNIVLMTSGIMDYSETYQEVASLIYTPSFPVQILCVGVIVPIAEELVFRGLIYKRLRGYCPVALALILSAVLFGLYHGNIVQILYAIPAGLALAYLYEKYGSVFAPIAAHMVMNITSCVATEFGWFDSILRW